MIAEIADAPVFEMPTGALLLGAMSIALRFNRSIYDSLYVALALQERCALVTADRRLYDAVAPSYLETMLWIEDVPLLAAD
ncbi:MAG: type II toxin-antitoxin system VapC family toxin [Anaerolineaceae bacterium]